MKLLAAVAIAVLCAGCGDVGPSQETLNLRGEARIKLFRECMELAAKMPRQADDDVADIVATCSNHSGYMTTHLKAREPS